MFSSFVTVLLFSCSAIASERAGRYLGGQRVNITRLLIATMIMGSITLVFYRETLTASTYGWLFLSGVVGFGVGDAAQFVGYARIGARLTILLSLCTAPLWSAWVEWLWLGVGLDFAEIIASLVIIIGVMMAILGREERIPHLYGSRWVGIGFGLAAGFGQGAGSVLSRKAYVVAQESALQLPGFSAAAQRASGGLVTVALILLGALLFRGFTIPKPRVVVSKRKAWKWLMGSTFLGPIFGVSCFQWALSTTPSGIVNAIIAMTPITMIPLAMLIDKIRPSLLSVLGAFCAVGGVLLLIFAS